MSTQTLLCTFTYNRLAFDVGEKYHDKENTVPKYRLAEEPKRNEVGRLPKWARSDFYSLKKPGWNVIKDAEDSDMMTAQSNTV